MIEDVAFMDRYALRVTYKAPPSSNYDAKICALIDGGVLCCVKENSETRSLIFEYVQAHKALSDMRRIAVTIPYIVSVVVYPKGFSCDTCCCFGSTPENEVV